MKARIFERDFDPLQMLTDKLKLNLWHKEKYKVKDVNKPTLEQISTDYLDFS